jgi:reductive dehalogenase
MAKKNKIKRADFSRREFIKMGGAVAAGLQIGAVAGAGIAAGKDPSTHTGWQHLGDNTQFVDRKKLQITGPAYKITGETRRPDLVESVFNRNPIIRQQMRVEERRMTATPDGGETGPMASPESAPDVAPETTVGMGQGEPPTQQFPPVENFPEPLLSHYRKHPHVYDLDKIRIEEVMPKRAKDVEKYGEFYTLINAWSGSWQTSEPITTPPEVSDFHLGSGRRARKIGKPVPFKSPVHAAQLIKKVTHHFGAAMVGITTINPDWCYNHSLRGSKDRGSYEVPKHWEYVIAFGVPHQWEQVNSNPNFGTSFDAYSRATIAARRLETFIKMLGYPARRHSPMDGYDLIAVPYLVKTGLGQQGRHGIIITPETGSNFRAAFVTTSLPMEIDHPIDFGVKEFCAHCKICAEICPSSSISFEENNEKMNTRGYRHWEINQTSCFNYWMQSMGGMGCRLCLIACPYSRKNNWVHGLARNVDIHDPTGLTEKGLTFMQKKLFDAPEAYEYLPPPDGNLSNFREQPEWLRVDEYLDIDVTDPTKEGIS